jgi:hypothetical protein
MPAHARLRAERHRIIFALVSRDNTEKRRETVVSPEALSEVNGIQTRRILTIILAAPRPVAMLPQTDRVQAIRC